MECEASAERLRELRISWVATSTPPCSSTRSSTWPSRPTISPSPAGCSDPGDSLIVSLPNFASTQARRFGTDWFHLDLPRHRSHFTPPGLERLLERTGFAVENVSTSSSADGLPMSLSNRRSKGRRPISGVKRYLALAAVLGASPLGAAVDRAAGAGDLLHAVARRPAA